jgi:hypothetical protein
MKWPLFNKGFTLWASIFLIPYAVSFGQVSLPKSTGKYGVGVNAVQLIDNSRFDEFAPVNQYRHVQVSLYYPIEKRSDGMRALEIQGTYVIALFDKFFKNYHEPLLDHPSHKFPEVKFLPLT